MNKNSPKRDRFGLPLSEEALQDRVERGAELLDKLLPQWHHRIDIKQLDQTAASFVEGRGCVLAQLAIVPSSVIATFSAAKVQLRISENTTYSHGFTLERPDFEYNSQWRTLTGAWINEIDARQQRDREI